MRYEPRAQAFIASRMRDFYAGRMRDRSGRVVRNKQQALAIALSESRAKGLHVPRERKGQMPRKGQFKKGGGRVGDGRSRKRRSHSKALTVYRPAPVVVTRTRHVKVPVRVRSKSGGGRALMRREHGAGEFMPGPFRVKSMAVSAALGYAKGGHGLTQLNELIEKLPTVGGVPKMAVAALLLNKFADRGDWYDAAAQAAADIAAYEFGQAGLAMKGEDDDEY
jgi:hypothetical protein